MKATVQSQPDILKISLIARKGEWEVLKECVGGKTEVEVISTVEAWYELLDKVLNSGKREVSVYTERD